MLASEPVGPGINTPGGMDDVKDRGEKLNMGLSGYHWGGGGVIYYLGGPLSII